jgi:hypothetical protein
MRVIEFMWLLQVAASCCYLCDVVLLYLGEAWGVLSTEGGIHWEACVGLALAGGSFRTTHGSCWDPVHSLPTISLFKVMVWSWSWSRSRFHQDLHQYYTIMPERISAFETCFQIADSYPTV